MSGKVKLVFFFLVVTMSGISQSMACVGCREGSNMSNEPQTFLSGISFSWSVLFMLGFVFSLLIGMTLYMRRTCVQLAAKNATLIQK